MQEKTHKNKQALQMQSLTISHRQPVSIQSPTAPTATLEEKKKKKHINKNK